MFLLHNTRFLINWTTNMIFISNSEMTRTMSLRRSRMVPRLTNTGLDLDCFQRRLRAWKLNISSPRLVTINGRCHTQLNSAVWFDGVFYCNNDHAFAELQVACNYCDIELRICSPLKYWDLTKYRQSREKYQIKWLFLSIANILQLCLLELVLPIAKINFLFFQLP